MPTFIRAVVGDRYVDHGIPDSSNSFDLREQIEALQAWLEHHPDALDPAERWVANVGFEIDKETLGGGPPIPRRLMELCLKSNLEIWLSQYGRSFPPVDD